MILGTLLEALLRRGVTLVATSNLPPGALYRGGLHRERFLPAIALIEKHCRVMELDAGVDYRLRQLERATLYFGPAAGDAETRMAAEFERLADGAGMRDVKVQVAGRSLRARREAEDVVWFDFRELCEGPRSAADYIEIARCYQTVFLGGVPVMDATADDSARRFVTLIDELYDRGVKLVVSAAAGEPGGLYRGERLALSSAAPRAGCTRCRAARTSRSRTGPEATIAAMEMLQQPIFWVELGAIIWINLLVSGDNAVMIALAARSLPPKQQKLAVSGEARRPWRCGWS